MNSWLSNIIAGNQLTPPLPGPPGPPFAPTSADNGLSVDPITGRIVLGNDVGGTGAELLSDREIDQQNFLFRLINGGLSSFTVDPLAGLFQLGDGAGAGNASQIEILDALQSFTYYTAGGNRFSEITNQVANIGDIDSTGASGLLLRLDYLNDFWAVGDLNGLTTGFQASGSPSNEYYAIGALNTYLEIDGLNGIFTFGNRGGFSGNETHLSIDDGIEEFQFTSVSGGMLTLTPTQQILGIGTTTNLLIDNVTDLAQFETNSFAVFTPGSGFSLTTDMAAGLFSMGDINGLNDGLQIVINAMTGVFGIGNTAANAVIRMNGNTGFTGTVTPVTSITVDGGIVTAVS